MMPGFEEFEQQKGTTRKEDPYSRRHSSERTPSAEQVITITTITTFSRKFHRYFLWGSVLGVLGALAIAFFLPWTYSVKFTAAIDDNSAPANFDRSFFKEAFEGYIGHHNNYANFIRLINKDLHAETYSSDVNDDNRIRVEVGLQKKSSDIGLSITSHYDNLGNIGYEKMITILNQIIIQHNEREARVFEKSTAIKLKEAMEKDKQFMAGIATDLSTFLEKQTEIENSYYQLIADNASYAKNDTPIHNTQNAQIAYNLNRDQYNYSALIDLAHIEILHILKNALNRKFIDQEKFVAELKKVSDLQIRFNLLTQQKSYLDQAVNVNASIVGEMYKNGLATIDRAKYFLPALRIIDSDRNKGFIPKCDLITNALILTLFYFSCCFIFCLAGFIRHVRDAEMSYQIPIT